MSKLILNDNRDGQQDAFEVSSSAGFIDYICDIFIAIRLIVNSNDFTCNRSAPFWDTFLSRKWLWGGFG